MSNNEIIKAAGALLWRSSATGYELAVIHRQRYDDWTLPKGKLEQGESWRDAALREVREETGYSADILGFAGAIAYETTSGPKVVRFWHMKAVSDLGLELDKEVASVLWMTPNVARVRLQYPLEKALVEAWDSSPRELQMIERPLLRSISWFRLSWRRLMNLFRPLSLRRLETTLQIFEAELETGKGHPPGSSELQIVEADLETGKGDPPGSSELEIVDTDLVTGKGDPPRSSDLQIVDTDLETDKGDPRGSSDRKSKQLLDKAWQSLYEGDSEKGWRCLKAADRLRLNGAGEEELKDEARVILAEVRDKSDDISKWRQETIGSLLTDSRSELKAWLLAQEVVRAKRILDEHHDNVYHKLVILKSRLHLLTVVGVIAIALWITWPPLSPAVESLALATSDNRAVATSLSTRWLWIAVVLSGIMGAVFSGFSSSMSSDQKKTRIPAELSNSTLTFARLSLSMVSAIAVSIFLFSGVLDLPKPSLELLLVVAFVSGFSDRLLLRAIESIAK